ncbi:hypothetical protein HG537_0D01720 [Torulaspora globosa]|uniref:Sugar phosphate phosphatase n=1 Tax=Torulaspora globosa TaxID=48254 RepID=A0A7H9HS90_9SACH|nr:hypothetical protein HG537_0D01720 [Torulaspora sp. CBS 2947]
MGLPGRFLTSDKGTFGEHTARVRWPIIVQNAVDDLGATLEDIEGDNERLEQGKGIQDQLRELREDILSDGKLKKFNEEEMEVANVPKSFNEELERFGDVSWFDAEWLFAEIYLYRRINVLFAQQSLWRGFDVFDRVKQSTFRSSLHGVVELALRYRSLCEQLKAIGGDEEALKLLFKEFVDISLWGNATDLSLLTDATIEDIKSIQGAKVRQESEANILVNDTERAWEAVKHASGNSKRVDFVLDNSGFELYADMMLAAFLLESKLVTKCVFHAKDIPYMVSDVVLEDFDILLKDLKDREFFPVTDASSKEALDFFADTITDYVSSGKIEVREDMFWTTHLDYWNINPSETKYHGAEIYKYLVESTLVIFKGDLNYRKLTGDRKWVRTTPWLEAIGPLAHSGITSLSLRTCKADVQVALPEGVDEKLSKLWEKDHPGHGSWWSSSGKWAVICFASGK